MRVKIHPVLLNNSLIQLNSSLFLEKLSLLICLGNFAISHCSAAVSSHKADPGGVKIVGFPVKFPVSREFARRRVRSALRRQPAGPEAGDSNPPRTQKPASTCMNGGMTSCIELTCTCKSAGPGYASQSFTAASGWSATETVWPHRPNARATPAGWRLKDYCSARRAESFQPHARTC